MSCYQYLHRQLFHIITKHLTSDVRISEADRKVPASYFLRNYSWSQMSPSPWSIWDESPTRIRSSFHHWALRHLPQSWNRIFLFIFTTSLLFFSNYPVTEVFPSGTFVSLISTEDPLEYKLTSYFHFPHFCYFQNLRLSTGSITFGVTVTPTLSRLNLSLRNLAFYCRRNSTQQKSLYNVTIFFFFRKDILQDSETAWGGGPISPAKRSPSPQWHPNLLTMNSDNKVTAQGTPVVLLTNTEA